MIVYSIKDPKKFRNTLPYCTSDTDGAANLIPEKFINEYVETMEDVGSDINRHGKILIHNHLTRKEIKYTSKEINDILSTMEGGEIPKNKEIIAAAIISEITPDALMQSYLRSQFHQGGFGDFSENVLTNEIAWGNIINGTAIKQITRLSRAIDITTHEDRHLTVVSQTVFSDKFSGPDGVDNVNPTPLCSCNVTLEIRLLDNAPPNPSSISITPSVEIYVVPGREDLFKEIYTGFIENFQKEKIPINEIDPKNLELLIPDKKERARYMRGENLKKYSKVDEEIIKILNKNFSPSGSAVYERGLNFIAAARLIAEYTSNEDLKADLKSLEDFWIAFYFRKNELTKEDLTNLQSVLIENVQKHVYPNDTTHPFEVVKNELDAAENHLNWKPRHQQKTQSGLGQKIERIETPIAKFTPEQEKAWEVITNDDASKPAWFVRLPKWEQDYFINRVSAWQQQVEQWQQQVNAAPSQEEKKAIGPQPNLGEFLGSVPTTIRRYPGAANAYVTSVNITPNNPNNPKILFKKIRSSVLVPSKMEVKDQDDYDEKLKITRQNLEQLVVSAILEKKNVNGKLPILLQTLYSPPKEPPGNENNRIMMQAFGSLRDHLEDSENFSRFLEEHNISSNITSVNLLYSNRPVNIARGLSWIWNRFSEQGRESRRTDAVFRNLATPEKRKEDPLLDAALRSYESMPYIWNTLFGTLPADSNPMAERAALEQIIASRLGIRIGSCLSGKDREELVTQIAIAQLEFYTTHKKFPPPYNATGRDYLLRTEFISSVANAYLSGHGQTLAGENAKGSNGLKNIKYVLGNTICKEIINIEHKKGNSDPIKFSQKIASLNKVSLDHLEVEGSAEAFKNALKTYQDTQPKPRKKSEEKIAIPFDSSERLPSVTLSKKTTQQPEIQPVPSRPKQRRPSSPGS